MNSEEAMKKGFNAGYRMEQFNPKLSGQLQASLEGQDNPYAQGFLAGRAEFMREQARELSSLYEAERDGREIDREKEDREQER